MGPHKYTKIPKITIIAKNNAKKQIKGATLANITNY